MNEVLPNAVLHDDVWTFEIVSKPTNQNKNIQTINLKEPILLVELRKLVQRRVLRDERARLRLLLQRRVLLLIRSLLHLFNGVVQRDLRRLVGVLGSLRRDLSALSLRESDLLDYCFAFSMPSALPRCSALTSSTQS